MGITEMFAGEETQGFLAWANQAAFEAVNSFAGQTGWLHPLMVGYATYGVALFAALLLAGWWLARRAPTAPSSTAPSSAPSPTALTPSGQPARRMAAALWAPVGMLIALGLNQVLVASVHELRPYTVLPAAEVLVARSADYAFPSDHAVMAGAVAAGVWLVSRRLGYLAAAAALLMGFARVYVGAHWPGDVLVGLVFGAAVVVLGYLLGRTPLTRAVTQLTRTRLRPLLTAHATTPDRAETGPDEPSEAARLGSSSSRDGGSPQQTASDQARSEATVRAQGPRDTVW